MTWQPIETAPKGEEVLVVARHGWVSIGRFNGYDWDATFEGNQVFNWNEESENVIAPTHWMPLPDPPS